MKVKGHGQAKVLTSPEITLLFQDGFTTLRDRALFGVMLYCGCRVSEALALEVSDIKSDVITFRREITKGKLATRQVAAHPRLMYLLSEYKPEGEGQYLFPGRWGRGRMTRAGADLILKAACDRVGLVGASTHSFRRTALTNMSSAGVPLRVIQEISGHCSLAQLQKYLEVSPDEVKQAVGALPFEF